MPAEIHRAEAKIAYPNSMSAQTPMLDGHGRVCL
jgi:hypothetical protein